MPAAPGTRLISQPGRAPVLVLHPSRLEVIEGPDAAKAIDIGSESVKVGTAPDNHLVLSDSAVSAHHFEILVTSAGRLLRDLGSTNGTVVDGYRVGSIYLPDDTEIAVGHSRLRCCMLEQEVQVPLTTRTNFGQLLGHSAVMRAAFAVLERAARSDATVLITGESGTGKELAARALHEASDRKDGPYVVFDCGAAAPSLLESQLFGHTKGAFTGAHEARAGVFEEAHGGTLVLDELGELPLDLQPKLLRALETRSVQRVGENRPRTVDVRFVACTNRNLQEEVRAGRFRQDLYYRVSVVTVRLPPLRERKEEIPRLVRHFASQFRADSPSDIPPSLAVMLENHDWPGNVRELRNFVERMVVLGDLDPSTWVNDCPAPPLPSAVEEPPVHLPFHEAKQHWTERFERAYFTRLLAAHGHNISEAARAAGLSRQSCYRLMEKHGLRGT